MAFGDSQYEATLLLRTIRGTFDFSGRSRRTEVAWWWVASALVPRLGESGVAWVAPEEAGQMAGALLALLFAAAFPALLVRRLHDQDRTGWWMLIIPAAIALNLPEAIASRPKFVHGTVVVEPHGLFLLIDIILLLAVVAFLVAPETIGPNRFGPDPREDQPGDIEEQRTAGFGA